MMPRVAVTDLPGPTPRVACLEVHERGEWLRATGYVNEAYCDVMIAKATLDGLSVPQVRDFISKMLHIGKVRH